MCQALLSKLVPAMLLQLKSVHLLSNRISHLSGKGARLKVELEYIHKCLPQCHHTPDRPCRCYWAKHDSPHTCTHILFHLTHTLKQKGIHLFVFKLSVSANTELVLVCDIIKHSNLTSSHVDICDINAVS